MLASNILTYARPKGQMPLRYKDFLEDSSEPLEIMGAITMFISLAHEQY